MLKRKAASGSNKTTAAAGVKKKRDPPDAAQVQSGLVVGVAMQTSKRVKAVGTDGGEKLQPVHADRGRSSQG